MATIQVQEWKSNDPVEVMIFAHNKLGFITGFHKRSSQLNTVCLLQCFGQVLS